MSAQSHNPSFPPITLDYARRISAALIELIPPKKIDAAAIDAMAHDAARLGASPGWLMDLSRVEDFDVDCMQAISEALENARDHGGLRGIVMVAPDMMVRAMIQGSIPQPPPVPVHLVDTRENGLKALGIHLPPL